MIRKIGSPLGDTIVASLLRTSVEGLDGNDVLIGRSSDQLLGGDGNDRLIAGFGDSYLDGGASNDSLSDGFGNDALFGGDGNDQISSSSGGSDWIDGGAGDDSISISRSSGGDGIVAFGGDGNDSFVVSTQFSQYTGVVLYGGDGDDVVEVVGAMGTVDILFGDGADLLILDNLSQPPFFAVTTVHDFQAGAGGDRIDFEGLLTQVTNGANITVNPFASGKLSLTQNGADVQFQSNGVTFLVLEGVSAAALTAYNLGGYAQNGSIEAPSTVAGTDGDDRLYGASGADTLDGGLGRDTLIGGMGDDNLSGGDGNDVLNGGSGNDHLDGGLGNDILRGGPGSDILIGGDGNDTLLTQRGSDTIDGGDGNDSATIATASGDVVHAAMGAGTDSVTITAVAGSSVFVDTGTEADRVTLAFPSGAVNLALGAGADSITLNGVYNASGSLVVTDFQTGDAGDWIDLTNLLTASLTGWSGASNPFGTQQLRLLQSGADTLLQLDAVGGDGQWKTVATLLNTDSAAFTAANLRGMAPDGSAPAGFVFPVGSAVGTIGPDVMTASASGSSLSGGAGDDILNGGAGFDVINGGAGNDTIDGGGANDTLDGGAGIDTVNGGDGNDTIKVASGADTVHGGEGDDTITGTVAGAHLFGDGGNDFIDEQGGAAEIDGGEGDDILQVWVSGNITETVRGGAGDDVLWTVGSGSPTYVVDMGPGRDYLLILSYTAATITLGAGADAVFFSPYPATGPAPSFVVTDFEAGAAGDWLQLDGLLSLPGSTWGWTGNPFAGGYARVVQSGADTLVQVDRDGAGTVYDFTTYAVLQNLDASLLTKENFGFGTAAVDVFDLRAGAQGEYYGFDGDDVFYLGAAFANPAVASGGGLEDRVAITAGTGADTVILQGDYAGGLLLDESSLAEVETLRLLSHTDTTWGGEGAGPFSYVLQTDGYLVENGQELLVDASALAADETLTFDGLGEVGVLHVVGGAGADDITGGDGADLLEGGDGNDTLDGSYGDDVMAGGAGDDTYFVDDAGDLAVEQSGKGTDTVFTLLAAYTLPDNIENLTAELYADVTLTGNALGNVITGSLGNDTIDGGLGADTMAGGTGNDIYYVDDANDVVTENAGEGYDEVRTTIANYVLPANVEKLTYIGTGNFSYTGGAGNDNVGGNSGNDFFDLTQGGADKASGGGGTDAFSFGATFGAGDSVDGGAGSDTVGIRGDYTGASKLTITAGQLVNVETLSIMTSLGGPVGYDISWSDGNLATNQRMAIYAGNLQTGENVTFDGSAETHGYFVMYGGLGTDTLKGGALSDGFYFGPGKFSQADHVDGGGGGQNQLGLDGSYDFSAGSALGTFGGNFTNIQTIVLYAGDPIYNIVTNDAAVAAGKLLTIFGTPVGSNLVFDGSAETDGAFKILSGTGDDTLSGGHGNDTLYGNLGADTLTGGAGNDVFLYTDAAQSTAAKTDHILDFDAGDKVDLSQVDADSTQAGDQAFSYIGAGAFGHHAGELRADFANGVWTIQGDTDGDGNADFTLLVTAVNGHQMAGTDFVL